VADHVKSVMEQLNRAQAFAGSPKARNLYRDAYEVIKALRPTVHCHRCGGDWTAAQTDQGFCPACPEYRNPHASLSVRSAQRQQ
jgi:Zn finger protein HypA/HybF involved in hydrogenase expression